MNVRTTHHTQLVDAADTELSEVERGVVQVAFKNMVAKKRAAWRALTAPGPDADARCVCDGLGRAPQQLLR